MGSGKPRLVELAVNTLVGWELVLDEENEALMLPFSKEEIESALHSVKTNTIQCQDRTGYRLKSSGEQLRT